MTHTNGDQAIEIRIINYSEGTVDGQPVRRDHYDNIHAACVAFAVPRAQQTGRAILAHAIDTAGPQPAEYWIDIHPNGQVTESDKPTGTVPAAAAQPFADATAAHYEPRTDRRGHDIGHDGAAVRNGKIPATPATDPARDLPADARLHADAHDSAPIQHVLYSPPVTPPTEADGERLLHYPLPAAAAYQSGGQVASLPPADPAAASQPYQPPTLNDLLAHRPAPPAGPAQLGWRALLRHLTGGLIKLPAGPEELEHRNAVAAVQRSLSGPKTVVVINPKGGADKTTATLLIAATFGIHRGGYTLAWDNNETRGTMGWRAIQGRHTNTAVDLLRELHRFQDAQSARVGDLDNFVRSQGSAQFDVLASDEDAASAASIDAEAFKALHRSLARFYRVIVVDTGNNMRASNWQAAVEAADQLVIVSTIREDTAQSAAWVADALNAAGQGGKVRNAVTVLAAPSPKPDEVLAQRLRKHFTGLTRAVVDVPFDASLVAGGPINVDALTPASREAWLRVTALVADGL